MIYTEPRLTADDEGALRLIGQQRDRLKLYTQHNPRRWFGSLRRSTFARAIQGSNSIEGYNATIDEAIAAIDDEEPADEKTETWRAITGYRDAMTYILQASQDPYFEPGKQFLKSLHFMMVGHDMAKSPGQWRPGAVTVVNRRTGETVYEAPPAEAVDALVEELVAGLKAESNSPAIVKAAMAHLNLTMIHPFKDGNGRMARALQTLVLGRDGVLHPNFSSIEEWLGRHTEDYYRILGETGNGAWNPRNDAGPWVRFCLRAHYQQADTLIRRNEEYENLMEQIDGIVAREGLHDRTAVPLFDAALGRKLTNARYQLDADVSQYIAGRDLKLLSETGLLDPQGERRARVYFAGRELKAAREASRIARPLTDPYEVLHR
jgi:Fic family protein